MLLSDCDDATEGKNDGWPEDGNEDDVGGGGVLGADDGDVLGLDDGDVLGVLDGDVLGGDDG